MNLKEFYKEIDGDFDDVMSRMPMEKLIFKYLMKFLDDSSFMLLKEALNQGQLEEAFRASHTLKGICSNLGLTALQKAADELTECLRQQDDQEKALALFPAVNDEYQRVKAALMQLKESQ